MARLIEHIATERKNQGHLGWLEPGQVVEVGEHEFQTAIKSNDFKAVELSGSEEIDPDEFPKPAYSRYFDLTHYDWASPNLQKRLSKESTRTLRKIAMAVEDVTGVSQPWSEHSKAEDAVNSITHTAMEFGWVKQD